MSRLTWDNTGERMYELGVKRCVLFVMNNDGTYKNGVAWSGITSITENNTGAEEVACWADGHKYASLRTGEEFGATIKAYQCPIEFYECDGYSEIFTGLIACQQKRSKFGLCYITTIGNDTNGTSHGEKMHLIYGATASPSERSYNVINDSPEAMELSWEVSTEPIDFAEGYLPTAHFIIDPAFVWPRQFKKLKDLLYGTATTNSRLPDTEELIEVLSIPVLSDSFDNIVTDHLDRAIPMY